MFTLNDTFNRVLSQVREPYLDDPAIATVDRRHWERLFYSTWLPLAHINRPPENLRRMSWNAAGMIAVRWGENDAEHVEATAIAGAWGLATPTPPTGTELPPALPARTIDRPIAPAPGRQGWAIGAVTVIWSRLRRQ